MATSVIVVTQQKTQSTSYLDRTLILKSSIKRAAKDSWKDCVKRLCGYNMGEWRNSSYGGGAGGGAQKTFYGPYDMVYWLPDLSAP